MHSAEEILAVARSVLPRARKLIGRQNAHRLEMLLRRADRGEDVTAEIFELLQAHEETRTLLDARRPKRPPTRARRFRAWPKFFRRKASSEGYELVRTYRAAESHEDFEGALPDVDTTIVVEPSPARAPPVPEPPADTKLNEPLPSTTQRAGGGAAAGTPPDPPRSAYGLLECPETVVVGTAFDLTVGLSKEQQPGVAGGKLVRPSTSRGPYTMVVQLAADGLALAENETWRQELGVTVEEPYPQVTLHATALPQPEDERQTRIEATFSVDGQTIGLAVRYLTVAKEVSAETPAAEPAATGVDLPIPSAKTAPDLTVEIRIWESISGGRLRWTVESPYGITVPDGTESDIGSDPKSFAKDIVVGMNGVEGSAGLYPELRGFARTIADNMPQAVWQAIRAAAEHANGRPPTILILSEEPYVPWELAIVDPPLANDAPPFLSSQAIVGRWVFAENRPPPNPPADVDVAEMAVIWGVYDKTPGWLRLPEAEEEAKDLVDRYKASFKATGVDAASGPVFACLEGNPAADILHFSVHGKYDPDGIQQGLALVDGKFLDPVQVKGSDLPRAPFVFLNACQVGSGEAILGDYAGMADSFLYAGAAAVIAPLWSIDDGIAKKIATSFYEAALEHDTPAAEAIFRERQAFATTDKTSGTYLAYQFFGHPLLRLTAV